MRPTFASIMVLSLLLGCGKPVAVPVDSQVKVTPVVHQTPPAVSPSGWPLFRGDAQATGVARGNLPAKLEVVWKYKINNGAFEGTAAIVDGTVFIADLDGLVLAIDLKTGDRKWEKKFDNTGFSTSPAVQNGLMYLGDLDGKFHCLDTASGDEKWMVETGSTINSNANFYKDNVLVGSQDSTLYCLNAQNGTVVWKFTIADQIQCSPTVIENRCFVAGCDSKLHVVDLDKGEGLAGVPTGQPTMSSPAARGDVVYFGSEGGVFFAINWKTAKVVWTAEDERRSNPIRSSPAVTENLVIVGGRDKVVRAFDTAKGDEKWRFTTRQRVDSCPVVVGDRVFIGSSDGRLYELGLADGKERWKYEAGGGFTSSPAVADGKLVIANDDGTIYCFGAK